MSDGGIRVLKVRENGRENAGTCVFSCQGNVNVALAFWAGM